MASRGVVALSGGVVGGRPQRRGGENRSLLDRGIGVESAQAGDTEGAGI